MTTKIKIKSRTTLLPALAKVAGLWLLWGCAAWPSRFEATTPDAGTRGVPTNGVEHPTVQAAAPVTPPNLSRASRLQLLDELVARIREVHVMSAGAFANLGRTWEQDLALVRKEFETADSQAKLLVALRHLGNSLHDRHCKYNEPEPPTWARAGFSIEAELTEVGPRYYVDSVEDVELGRVISPGDVVLQLDGLPAAEITSHFALESNHNFLLGVARDIARHLSRRTTLDLEAEGRTTSEWVLQRHGTGETYLAKTKWRNETSSSDPAGAPGLESACREQAKDYGPYQLIAHGWGVCVFASDDDSYRAYPIVRQHTFLYAPASEADDEPKQRLRRDQLLLKKSLAQRKNVRGVVLDLRENSGGNNPNWFLDWWGAGPYTDDVVHYRIHRDLLGKDGSIPFIGSDEIASDYRKSALVGAANQGFTRGWPAFCPAGKCNWENRYVPRGRVTNAPVALLVGPNCMSACDSVTRIFAEFGFGPVIGEPTAAAYTFARIELPVAVGELDLGLMTVAVSYEVSGKTGRPIESVPIQITRPLSKTFANRAHYSRLLIDAAREALNATSNKRRFRP